MACAAIRHAHHDVAMMAVDKTAGKILSEAAAAGSVAVSRIRAGKTAGDDFLRRPNQQIIA